MKISTVLDHIDNGHMALPEFQRGYVWNRDQVRGLMDSLYRRHPVGGLLVWVTASEGATHRGDSNLPPGVVKLLLDGQQRMTSLYGIIRGKPPAFFDGNVQVFTGLYFHLDTEEFSFYQPVKMRDDSLWIDVSTLMQEGIGNLISMISGDAERARNLATYVERLNAITNIRDIDLHVEEVTGTDKTIDVVVDIFNRVNSGGTKLSKGDLALAKICADWPEGRAAMRNKLAKWRQVDYHFSLDWLLRNLNTVLTGEALFKVLHDIRTPEIQDGLKRAIQSVDYLLNLVSSRLGLDHDRVLFGRYAFPIMSHYLDRRGGKLDAKEQDKLLFWYLSSAMWGRFSGSTESVLNQDLDLLEEIDAGLDRLVEQLRLWHGDLTVRPDHFGGWSLGARFYPVLYLLTRVGESKDWGTGMPLRSKLLGHLSRLEVHHIFPKKILYARGYKRPEVNAVANFCFLTQDTNLQISASRPSVYFPEVATKHPGALESQWIPMDPQLWKLENYRDFLEARKVLLADAINAFLAELLHGEALSGTIDWEPNAAIPVAPTSQALGGIDSQEEEAILLELNEWVLSKGLPEGEFAYEVADTETGNPIALLDLAWPDGLQEGLSDPAAVLINEGAEVLSIANAQGFRCFTSSEPFRAYVEKTVLALTEDV